MTDVAQPPLPTGRFKTILILALPIVGGMVSQNILNLVDTAMVGRVGPTALAAVGIASFTNFMAIAIITGLGTGVQAIASRRQGGRPGVRDSDSAQWRFVARPGVGPAFDHRSLRCSPFRLPIAG